MSLQMQLRVPGTDEITDPKDIILMIVSLLDEGGNQFSWI
jgi:hypothetical protein